MINTVKKIRRLFPGKKIYIFCLMIIGLFLISLFDMVGVAAILPVVQLASGAPINQGYIGTLSSFLQMTDRTKLIVVSGTVLVISFLCKGIFSLLVKWYSNKFIFTQQSTTSVTILKKYLEEPYIKHRNRSAAEILRAASDAVNQTYNRYVLGMTGMIGEIFTILALMMFLLIIMPIPAIIAFAYFGITSWALQRILKKRVTYYGVRTIDALVNRTNAALEAINGFRENRIRGVSSRSLYKYQLKQVEFAETDRKQIFFQDVPKYVLEIIFILGIVLITVYLALTSGLESASYLLVFAAACIRILPSYTRLIASLNNFRGGIAASNLVDDDLKNLDENIEFSLIPGLPDIGEFAVVNSAHKSPKIDIEKLVFSYPGSEVNVINGMNLSIPSGTSIAIVGGSGSGKTTLIDLLLGLYTPASGCILVDGHDIQQNLAEWHKNIGYVPQDVFINNTTILESVAFGLNPSEIDENRVWECLRIAELEDLVKSFENGIHTMVGENGNRLSGGQKQRLGMARAIYRNPSVLILDEATSALDNETENKITTSINKLTGQMTVVIVAHRLSTVKDADKVIYLSNGQIQASGTFEEVRSVNSKFAKLVKLGQLPE